LLILEILTGHHPSQIIPEMKRILLSALIIGLSLSALPQNMIIPLWDGEPPNYRETGLQTLYDTTDIVRVSHVRYPDLAVFLPSKKNATGEAVVICPGGGYMRLAYDWEGSDVARWLSSHGIAAFVLKYRLPGPESNLVPHLSSLLDASRAVRLVRYHAAQWNLDPGKIGIMGFSAGGHLASTLSTHYDAGDANAADPVERMSCRPDFSILIYPVISMDPEITHGGSRRALLGEQPDEALAAHYSNERQVTAGTPPAILVHSGDDHSVPVENSIAYYRALQKNGVTASMHIYPYGGHGYSLAVGKGHLSTWPDRVAEWTRYLSGN